MTRHGYTDDDEFGTLNLYRANVNRAIGCRSGQEFMREMAAALDAMPVRSLEAGVLVDADGSCCAIGAVCLARGLDVTAVDYEDPESVARAVGVAKCLAAEIEYENDDGASWSLGDDGRMGDHETPSSRWRRMRSWVESKILSEEPKTTKASQ